MLGLRRVVGDSMEPTLSSGDIIVIDTLRPSNIGDVVIFEHKGKELVKRIVDTHDLRFFDLAGDNIKSSRYKNIKSDQIIGVMRTKVPRVFTLFAQRTNKSA